MRMPLVWAVGAIAIALAIIIGFEAPVGDSWSSYFEAREPMTWDRFLLINRYNHDFGNPRWGQIVMSLAYHCEPVIVALTPLVITGTALLALALLRGRRPRARDPEDAWLFVCLFAAIAITTPKVGLVWFYRPSCTNYAYPLLTQLAWLVPYRALLDGRHQRPWRTLIAIVPLGLLAGAGNEHTGPALACAALACIVVAWRRDRRIPLWSIAGVIALVAGTVFLLVAPGQLVRYGGLGQQPWLAPLVERGVGGTLSIVGVQLAWASVMTTVLLVAAREAKWPRLSIYTRRIASGCLVIAAVMIATSLLSPKLAPRLLAAPAMMIVLAMGVVFIELLRDPRAAKILRRACAAIACGVVAYALVVHVVTGREWRERLTLLEQAPRGSVVEVPRYTFARPWLVSFGDDFRSEDLRADIATRFELSGIRWH